MTPVKSMPSIITKNPSINLACFLATSFLSLAANTAYAVSCTANTTLSSLLGSTSQNECTVTPDFVKIGVYQFGICTSMPTNTDVSMCDFFLSSTIQRSSHWVSILRELSRELRKTLLSKKCIRTPLW